MIKYLFFISLIFSLIACHGSKSETIIFTPPDDVAEVIDSNMIVAPEEMVDDESFAVNSSSTKWATAGITDPNQLKIFIKFLRFWVDKRNIDSIAAHIEYPLSHPNIQTPQDFINNYHRYFDSKVINALRNQKLPQIYRNNKGARIGNGELWIKNISTGNIEEFKITAINN